MHPGLADELIPKLDCYVHDPGSKAMPVLVAATYAVGWCHDATAGRSATSQTCWSTRMR